MIIVGIDPGLDGAMAVLSASSAFGIPDLLALHDTPTLTVVGAKGTRREYDIHEMIARLVDFSTLDVRVFIEAVHAMPGQGVRSMFTMGFGAGIWAGILAARGLRYTYVTPQRWKRTMLDGTGKDKDAGRMRAMQLHPHDAALFKRKCDDGRADAVLIAEYGWRHGG